MALRNRHVERIEAYGVGGIAGAQVHQIASAKAREIPEDLLGRAAMRVNEAHPLAGERSCMSMLYANVVFPVPVLPTQ